MICNTFKRLALDTWDKIAKSRTVGFQLKEETLTDLNMLDLKVRHPYEISVQVFNKAEEGEHGADWEWWFTDKTKKWLGFRVQAKIISITNDRFAHLHYRKDDKSLHQCDLLILKAGMGTHKTIPIYCLFVQTDDLTKLATTYTAGTTSEVLGCSLLSADAVQKLRPAKKLKDTNAMIPWHLLVCKPDNKDVLEHLTDFIGSKLGIIIQEEDYLADEPPHYVSRLVFNQGEVSSEGEQSTGLAGVMVYQDNASI